MSRTLVLEYTTDTIDIDGVEYLKIDSIDIISDNSGIRLLFDNEFSDLGDIEIALIKNMGKIYAVSNICPHKHAPKIFDGIIKDRTVTCPLHAWKYNLETGKNTNTHDGIKKLDKYDVKIIDDTIYLQKPEPKVPAWRTAPL